MPTYECGARLTPSSPHPQSYTLMLWSLPRPRLARKVLDQEAVTDTFLKTLPVETDHYQIVYPVSRRAPPGAAVPVCSH